MPLTEAPICRRADHVLRSWQVREMSGTYYVAGLDYRSGDPLTSSVIKFFDSEQQLMLDLDGVVWLIVQDDYYHPGYSDRTEEIIDLIAEPRTKRNVAALTVEQERELRRLTSRK